MIRINNVERMAAVRRTLEVLLILSVSVVLGVVVDQMVFPFIGGMFAAYVADLPLGARRA